MKTAVVLEYSNSGCRFTFTWDGKVETVEGKTVLDVLLKCSVHQLDGVMTMMEVTGESMQKAIEFATLMRSMTPKTIN